MIEFWPSRARAQWSSPRLEGRRRHDFKPFRNCAQNGLVFLDYFSAMVDDRGMLKHTLSDEGLRPSAAGYKIMARLAEKAITQALGTTD